MVKYKFQVQPPSSRKRKSVTIPDQSLSIEEIIKRFVRGIGVDVIQREAVYMNQSEFDFEKLNRMDFADRAAVADEVKQRTEAIAEQLKASERAQAEASAAKAAQQAKVAAEQTAKPADSPAQGRAGSGIV